MLNLIELTHWTSRKSDYSNGVNETKSFKTFCEILKGEKYKVEGRGYTIKYEGRVLKGVQMICFTERKASKKICTRFGTFGISYKIESLIDKGCLPAIYYSDVERRRIDPILKHWVTNDSINSNDLRLPYLMLSEPKKHSWQREWRLVLNISKNTKKEVIYWKMENKHISTLRVPKKFKVEVEQLRDELGLQCKVITHLY